MSNLSDAETKLFHALGASLWVELVEGTKGTTPIPAPRAYSMIAVEVFIKNLSGPAVEALRRALIHFDKGGFRGTPEFDRLISFGD